MLHNIFSKLHHFIQLPKDILHEHKLKHHLLKSLDWHHENILRKAEEVIMTLSQGKNDKCTLSMTLALLNDIGDSRLRMKYYLRMLYKLKHGKYLINKDMFNEYMECYKDTRVLAHYCSKSFIAVRDSKRSLTVSSGRQGIKH
jgi:hypothetical protein